ncbi:angiogenic factor with G patch and FHA domains 1-like isoform X2 [Haliotis rubra]|uniref:angiogenic factor with G patch and FHA domains 1-like isoform X2 n=1 Tax=Haliotis rubra TaxID=36100 RepID=UPI001EE59995|nr:angiogenic factor with G patch and FHA domains 1-like isoform X2 [Haliotis rubra]
MAGDDMEIETLKAKVLELEAELTAVKQELEDAHKEIEKGAKALEKKKRQLETANTYNDDLREQMTALSREIQDFRDRRRTMKEAGLQAVAEEILTELGEKPLPNWENGETTTLVGTDKPISIAESLKQTAEATLSQSGFVFDDNSGLYYDYKSGYYYNHEQGLYYDPATGTYFYYEEASGEYKFHSQVEPLQYTCPPSQSQPRNPTAEPSGNKEKVKKKKSKDKRRREREETIHTSQSDVDEVTSALHKLEIEKSRQHAIEVSSNWPPCIRVMVSESDCLSQATLFIVTCDGASIGREKGMNNLIRIPDINVSKVQSESTVISHGDVLQVGNTTLSLHIHPGSDTCDECEPGQVLGRLQAEEKANREVKIVSRADRLKEHKQQLKQIKRRYGLENCAYVDNTTAIHNPAYEDKAASRRQTVGSDNPHAPDEGPASVMQPISTQNKGHKLLAKMGWKEGQGLGKDNTGIAEPINVMLRTNQAAGLGSGAAVQKSLDDVQMAGKSQRWLQAQQRYNKLAKQPVDLSKPTNMSLSFKKGPTIKLQPKVDLGAGESDEDGD